MGYRTIVTPTRVSALPLPKWFLRLRQFFSGAAGASASARLIVGTAATLGAAGLEAQSTAKTQAVTKRTGEPSAASVSEQFILTPAESIVIRTQTIRYRRAPMAVPGAAGLQLRSLDATEAELAAAADRARRRDSVAAADSARAATAAEARRRALYAAPEAFVSPPYIPRRSSGGGHASHASHASHSSHSSGGWV